MTDLQSISPQDLNEKLRRFYAEMAPRTNEKRTQSLPENQASEYHRNSFKNLRSAINRHLHVIGRDIDIVRDKCFKGANDMFDGKLKFNVREGLSRPTKHKETIDIGDLMKINTYLTSSDNPILLRYHMWYILSIHFVSRGLEFHQQLKLNSFDFTSDENGEYAKLNHETKQKNHQGGDENKEEPCDKRMYAVAGSPHCPVNLLRKLIEKTDPNAVSLFNHCSKDALASPGTTGIWFTRKPVKEYQFGRFMSEISSGSECSKRYTAHCLRSTAITALSDAGFELRHIMYMSGHKNEASIKSYNRSCSSIQKKHISNTLSSIVGAEPVQPNIGQVVVRPPLSLNLQSNRSHVDENLSVLQNVPPSQQQINSSNFMSAGFISNSAFNNCVFNFSEQKQA